MDYVITAAASGFIAGLVVGAVVTYLTAYCLKTKKDGYTAVPVSSDPRPTATLCAGDMIEGVRTTCESTDETGKIVAVVTKTEGFFLVKVQFSKPRATAPRFVLVAASEYFKSEKPLSVGNFTTEGFSFFGSGQHPTGQEFPLFQYKVV
jgi:hypothetical protein